MRGLAEEETARGGIMQKLIDRIIHNSFINIFGPYECISHTTNEVISMNASRMTFFNGCCVAF